MAVGKTIASCRSVEAVASFSGDRHRRQQGYCLLRRAKRWLRPSARHDNRLKARAKLRGSEKPNLRPPSLGDYCSGASEGMRLDYVGSRTPSKMRSTLGSGISLVQHAQKPDSEWTLPFPAGPADEGGHTETEPAWPQPAV